jgi:hypothetical protein
LVELGEFAQPIELKLIRKANKREGLNFMTPSIEEFCDQRTGALPTPKMGIKKPAPKSGF